MDLVGPFFSACLQSAGLPFSSVPERLPPALLAPGDWEQTFRAAPPAPLPEPVPEKQPAPQPISAETTPAARPAKKFGLLPFIAAVALVSVVVLVITGYLLFGREPSPPTSTQVAGLVTNAPLASEVVVVPDTQEPATEVPVVPQEVTLAPPVETDQQPVPQKDGSGLILIPAGEFLMGAAPFDTQAEDIEKPAHPVMLKDFWIDQTEVTNDMFIRFVDETGYLTEAERDGSLSYRYDTESLQWLDFEADWRHPAGPGKSLDFFSS